MEKPYVGTPPGRKTFRIRMANSWKLFFHVYFRNAVKTQSRQFKLINRTFENVQITFSKLFMYSYPCWLVDQTFGTKIAISENFQFHI